MSAPLHLEVTVINKLSFGVGSSKQEEFSSGWDSSFWHGPSCQHNRLAPAKDLHRVGIRSIAQASPLLGEPGKSPIYENVPPEPFSKASVSIAVVYTRGPSTVTHREPPGVCACNTSPRDWGAFPQLRNVLCPHRMHTQHSDPINETFTTHSC